MEETKPQPRTDSQATLTARTDNSQEKIADMEDTMRSTPAGCELFTSQNQTVVLPPLTLDLRTKKMPVAITFFILLFCSCLSIIAIYFGIRYGAPTAHPSIYLGVSTVLFGVSSLYSWFTRLHRLTMSKSKNYRPIGSTSKWQLDFFQWDFTFGFCLITAIIVVSVALPDKSSMPYIPGTLPRLTSCTLCIFLYNICIQLIVSNILTLSGARNPFAISSVPRGELARPALYSIVEDIVAVDGNMGMEWREAWDARYRASPNGAMRKMLLDLGWAWGVSGIAISSLLVGLIFNPSVTSHDAAWVVGWTVPWAWAGIMTIFTFWWVGRSLERERASVRF